MTTYERAGQIAEAVARRAPSRPRWHAVSLVVAAVVAIGLVDFLTGHELLFSTFYLVPVALATWRIGRRFAVLVAVLSVGAWLAGDLAAGAVYTHPFVPAWNAAIVLAFYLVVIGLLGRVHGMQKGLEERVRQRTVALTEEMAERERLEREIMEIGDRERRRIGRDLHDSLGQLLTGTALAGQVLHERLSARSVPEAAEASRIVTLVEEAVELTRALARGLDPVEIDAGGLAEGLSELARTTAEHAAVRCEFHTAGPLPIQDGPTATHLYRIAQEAVTNALRHGQPRHIVVRLDGTPRGMRLTVRDDGAGLPDRMPRDRGMGLRIMAHRASVVGGTFAIRSQRGAGTTVMCEVPA